MELGKLTRDLDRFAEEGLRTLLISQRQLSEQEFRDYKIKIDRAKSQVGPNREQAIEQAHATLECDLDIVGATAVEDKLQDQIQETISVFKQILYHIYNYDTMAN